MRSFSSSWPECTLTVTSGFAVSKSSMTDWMTSASRSVKKCQNDTVPLRWVGATSSIAWSAARRSEQPARPSAAAVAIAVSAPIWRR